MIITSDIKYIGVNDHAIDLFEGMYAVPNGMSYNSYAIIDEKIAIMDTVDAGFKEQWLTNIQAALKGRGPDYLIVQHMEPDHSANILSFMEIYPETIIVASAQAFAMMKNYFGTDFATKRLVVTDGTSLSLGRHKLFFVSAPMVHWPEVIMTYDSGDKVFFSADAFGKFGALDVDEDWKCEARRYYFGIVGKFGMSVQNLLKKVEKLEIQKICPLHGPVLSENLNQYMKLYNIWSSYQYETEGVVIAYTSIYGNTKKAVMMLAKILREKGCENVVIYDLARCDVTAAVADAFRYSALVLATTTYGGAIFPFMRQFIDYLVERNFSNRTVAFIENGSWAPIAAKAMKARFEKISGLHFADTTVKIMSTLDEENVVQLETLADELCCDNYKEELRV